MICLVVDDDEVSRAVLERFIARTPGLERTASCATGIEAAAVLAREPVDLLFLDVEMPELSGLELLASLERPPQVVLVTGSREYAVSAFEHNVADYLLKPVTYPRFLKAVQRVRQRTATATQPAATDTTVFLKVDRRLLRVDLREIDRVEARRDYVLVHLGARQLLVHSTMAAMERFLPAADFVRIHRSHIVRLDRITDIEADSLVVGRTVLPISESCRPALEARIRLP